MFRLNEVKIYGFWGDNLASVKFDSSLTFLIGENGSGKTTFINLIAATLLLDLNHLVRGPFSKIEVELVPTAPIERRTLKRKIIVENNLEPNGRRILAYKVHDKNGRLKKYEFGFSEDRLIRRSSPLYFGPEVSELRTLLSETIPTTWLSIHRNPDSDPDRSLRPGHDSLVDQKLANIADGFARYFSLLTSKVDYETRLFQQKIFLSLIDIETFDLQPGRALTVEDTAALTSMFLDLKMTTDAFVGKLREFSKVSKEALNFYSLPTDKAEAKIEKMSKEKARKNLLVWLNFRQIENLISSWRQFKQKEKEINKPREDFLSIVNSMFNRKTVSIDARNQVSIVTKSGKTLGLHQLSSGEKQLFILLADVLLQEQRPYVYIADEPELSLHVSWQSVLASNLRSLNPNAQLVFATHSPDIVSTFKKSVRRMEAYVRHV